MLCSNCDVSCNPGYTCECCQLPCCETCLFITYNQLEDFVYEEILFCGFCGEQVDNMLMNKYEDDTQDVFISYSTWLTQPEQKILLLIRNEMKEQRRRAAHNMLRIGR